MNSAEKRERHWMLKISFLISSRFGFVKGSFFIFSHRLLGRGCYGTGVPHGSLIAGWGTSFIWDHWITEVRRDFGSPVVQSPAQYKACYEIRSGCSESFSVRSWNALSFPRSGDQRTSPGNLLSCLAVLIKEKKFFLISGEPKLDTVSRCTVTSAEYRGIITSLGQWAVLLLKHPRMLLTFFAPWTQLRSRLPSSRALQVKPHVLPSVRAVNLHSLVAQGSSG